MSKDVFTKRNSCAKAFDNRPRSKNLKPKRSRAGQFDPPPLKASRISEDSNFTTPHLTICILINNVKRILKQGYRNRPFLIRVKHYFGGRFNQGNVRLYSFFYIRILFFWPKLPSLGRKYYFNIMNCSL